MVIWYLLTLALVHLVQCEYSQEALNDQVFNLPGTEHLNISFNHFSGYLTVDGVHNDSIHIHYWYVESSGNPSNDPLVWWTNGGPGCSGLIGMLSEFGPFFPNADLTLSSNPYSWNNLGNILNISNRI
jgi:carboxypeptidase C (cathepsin A)